MAWYALWKWFSPWSKRNMRDMIYWYSEYVLKTPEQRSKERIQKKREINTVMAQIGIMSTVVNILNNEYY